MWKGMCGRLARTGLSCSARDRQRQGSGYRIRPLGPRIAQFLHGGLLCALAQQLDRRGSDHHERVSRKPDLRRRDQRVQRRRRRVAAVPQASPASSDKLLDNQIEKRIHSDATLKKLRHRRRRRRRRRHADRHGADRGRPRQGRDSSPTSKASRASITRSSSTCLAATKGTAGTIKDKTKEGAEKTKEGAEKVGEKTKEGAEKVVDKTKEGLSKTGEVITDGWITTRVKSKFVGEDLLKDSDINVDTKDHVVTLKGTVMSAAGRRERSPKPRKSRASAGSWTS